MLRMRDDGEDPHRSRQPEIEVHDEDRDQDELDRLAHQQSGVVDAELSGRLQDAVQVVVEQQQRHANERDRQRPVRHVLQDRGRHLAAQQPDDASRQAAEQQRQDDGVRSDLVDRRLLAIDVVDGGLGDAELDQRQEGRRDQLDHDREDAALLRSEVTRQGDAADQPHAGPDEAGPEDAERVLDARSPFAPLHDPPVPPLLNARPHAAVRASSAKQCGQLPRCCARDRTMARTRSTAACASRRRCAGSASSSSITAASAPGVVGRHQPPVDAVGDQLGDA